MVKKVIKIIGAVLAIIGYSALLLFLGGSAHRRASDGDKQGDSTSEDGIGECQDRVDTISEGLSRAESSAGRCEEHLRRAEEILREAISKREPKECPLDS